MNPRSSFAPSLLQPDVLGVGHDADGDDDVAELALSTLPSLPLILALTRLGAPTLSSSTPGAGADRHALLGQRLLEERRDVGILDRHDPVEHLDHGNFGAHVVVEAGELDPDRAEPITSSFLGISGGVIAWR